MTKTKNVNAAIVFALLGIVVALIPNAAEAARRRRAVDHPSTVCPVGYSLKSGMIQENDGDLYPYGPIMAVCVGQRLIGPSPHAYYRDPRGIQFLDTASGSYYAGQPDCDDNEPEMWRWVGGGEDENQNGLVEGPTGVACVGVQSFINERWYYWRRGLGSTWLDMAYILGQER